MFKGLYRGLFYNGDYDLERLDILALIEPRILDALELMREQNDAVTHLTLEEQEIRMRSLFGGSFITLPFHYELHNALLDRQEAPERFMIWVSSVPTHDVCIYEGLRQLADGSRQVEGNEFYLNPRDVMSLRFAYHIRRGCIEFSSTEERVREGLVAQFTKSLKNIRVAPEVPEGYVCVDHAVRAALDPILVRSEGLKPKVLPASLYLIDL